MVKEDTTSLTPALDASSTPWAALNLVVGSFTSCSAFSMAWASAVPAVLSQHTTASVPATGVGPLGPSVNFTPVGLDGVGSWSATTSPATLASTVSVGTFLTSLTESIGTMSSAFSSALWSPAFSVNGVPSTLSRCPLRKATTWSLIGVGIVSRSAVSSIVSLRLSRDPDSWLVIDEVSIFRPGMPGIIWAVASVNSMRGLAGSVRRSPSRATTVEFSLSTSVVSATGSS